MRLWVSRTCSALVAVCLVLVTGACTDGDDPGNLFRRAVPATQVAPAGPAPTQVQVIAHPDDDLYFMAPDVQRFISAGWNSTTVVLTAGENNGSGSLDREHYAGRRQEGLRAAYAHMAGVDNVWKRVALTVAGKRVERDTLVAKPQVAVVFLNLPDGKDTLPLRTRALEALWQGEYATVPTVVPAGSRVADVQVYSAAELTSVLIGLLERATVARVLDAHPDHRFSADHTDHIHAARFAEMALSGIAAPIASYAYRGYGISGLPADLDPVTASGKADTMRVYGSYDTDVGLAGVGAARTYRLYPRYLAPALRVVGLPNGTLAFLAIVAGSVRVWTADAPERPQIVGGPPLLPPLAVVRQAGGALRLFAVRARDAHVITTVQTPTGLFSPWLDLGNPSPYGPYEVGSPEAVVDPGGRVYLFTKNYSGTVSMRVLSPGSLWTDWKDLDGVGVVESVTATVAANGCVELFAPTTKGIRRWVSPVPGMPPVAVPELLDAVPAGALSVLPGLEGGLQLFFRGSTDTTVRSMWRDRDGNWHPAVDLGSLPGRGPVAATNGADGATLVAATTVDGFTTAHQSAGVAAFRPDWRNLTVTGGQEAAAGVDASGHVVIGILGADGSLRVIREKATSRAFS